MALLWHNVPYRREIYTHVKYSSGKGRGPHLASLNPPPGAYARPLAIPGTGAKIFTWWSKSPYRKSDAKSAYIILHGINRNADTYFKALNNAWSHARHKSLGSANNDTVRVAPLFFATNRDSRVYNSSSLAWGDPNAWTGGAGSTHPEGSNVSVFAILDAFLDHFADRERYPNMKTIGFAGHGGGSQVLQRWAVLGKDNPDPSRVQVRYVIANPSSMLYFTKDRPVPVDLDTCPWYNDFRYGFDNFTVPYSGDGSPSYLFKRYAGRDVRYLVGLNDTNNSGDQLCGGRAAGGMKRRDRTLAYYRYIHLLAGSDIKNPTDFPGTWPALDPANAKASKASLYSIPASSHQTLNQFKGVNVTHHLVGVPDVGHGVQHMYHWKSGQAALFADSAELSSYNFLNMYKQ